MTPQGGAIKQQMEIVSTQLDRLMRAKALKIENIDLKTKKLNIDVGHLEDSCLLIGSSARLDCEIRANEIAQLELDLEQFEDNIVALESMKEALRQQMSGIVLAAPVANRTPRLNRH